jgi:glycosyltransferase involved in cell wall biosynthesis
MLLAKAFQSDTRPKLEAKTLASLGFTVHVLAWDRYGQFPDFDRVNGAEVHSLRPLRVSKFPRLGLLVGALIFQVLMMFEAIRLVSRTRRRVVIHSHDFNTLLVGCVLRILRLANALVYDCHELTYAVYGEWYNSLVGTLARVVEARCLAVADSVITVSKPLATYLQSLKSNTVTVENFPSLADIPASSKHELRALLNLPSENFIISFVGEIRFGCRLDLMLASASLITDNRVSFVVVGGGPLGHEFRQHAGELGEARLIVRPQVNYETALQYVAASDLTWVIYQNLAASISERSAIPWKFSESLACGVPVIVSDQTLVASIVRRFDCGIVLDRDKADYVAGTIERIASDEGTQRAMQIASEKAADVLELNWEMASSRLVAVYNHVARDGISR